MSGVGVGVVAAIQLMICNASIGVTSPLPLTSAAGGVEFAAGGCETTVDAEVVAGLAMTTIC